MQNGFTVTSDGAIHVNLATHMPDVTPAMIDWWFGWHSDSPERYRLWHPLAHVHAQWAAPPPAGSIGRARYVGYTSEVDGTRRHDDPGRHPIPPARGIRTGRSCRVHRRRRHRGVRPHRPGGSSIDIGYLAHHVAAVPRWQRHAFTFLGRRPEPRGPRSPLRAVVLAVRRLVALTELDARALLVHCSREMTHLATFLPALYDQES